MRNSRSSLKLCSTAWIVSSALYGRALKIIWVVAPGTDYRVQYKDSLVDPEWKELPGSVSNVGVKAFLQDPIPAAVQRIYRIKSF